MRNITRNTTKIKSPKVTKQELLASMMEIVNEDCSELNEEVNIGRASQ